MVVYHLSVFCLQFLYVQTLCREERRSRSRPKVFQKELGFKVRNHSKSFKHPPVTSTNFLPCHKTSSDSNPFPITSTPPNSPANGRRIPADPDGSGRGKWLAAEQTHAGCPSVHLHSKLTSLPKRWPLPRVFCQHAAQNSCQKALLMETKPNCRAPTACCLCTSSLRSVRWQIFSSSTGL